MKPLVIWRHPEWPGEDCVEVKDGEKGFYLRDQRRRLGHLFSSRSEARRLGWRAHVIEIA